jgi:hypothetical protein
VRLHEALVLPPPPLWCCSVVLQVARAASELEVTVNTYKAYEDLTQQLDAARVYLKEEAASDPDMAGGGQGWGARGGGGMMSGRHRRGGCRGCRSLSLSRRKQQQTRVSQVWVSAGSVRGGLGGRGGAVSGWR